MRIPGKKSATAAPGAGLPQLRRRLRQAERQVKRLQRRLEALEHESLENKQLNKQVAEMLDVIGEVLLPVEQRDEQRLRELLQRYDATL